MEPTSLDTCSASGHALALAMGVLLGSHVSPGCLEEVADGLFLVRHGAGAIWRRQHLRESEHERELVFGQEAARRTGRRMEGTQGRTSRH